MATLTVGSNQQFSRIADAIGAARDGDVIAVQAGTYTNDFSTISKSITLQGVGGMVSMVATVRPPNGKAILTTTTDVTIDHFEFSGAKVADRNGAGIRFEGGNLLITNSYFHDNENGILSGGFAGATVTIRNSEFARNGIGDGQTHNLYIGAIQQLTIQDSYFHDANIGHEIKSRALNTTITGSRIQNNNGNASYEIDLPDGGNGLIEGNLIQQSANSPNPVMIAFGEENASRGNSSLVVRNNTIVNDKFGGLAVWNATASQATMTNNQVYGFGGVAVNRGTVGQSGTTVLATRPTLNTGSPIGTSVPPVVPPPVIPPVVVPPPVVPPVVPPVTPQPVVVGSGPDRLVLMMAEDASGGDAQFTVKIDGQQVGGTQTVSALRSAGAEQSFTFNGTFGTGAHTIAVAFKNDNGGSNPAAGRNLYLRSAAFNGTVVTNAAADLLGNWTKQFTIPASVATPPVTPPPGTPPPVVPPVTPPPVVPPPVVPPPVVPPVVPPVTPPGPAPDIMLHLSGDAAQGDAQFVISVDGQQIGGVMTAAAAHGAGQTQDIAIRGTLGAGAHAVGITFLNDTPGAVGAADRNLYLDGVEVKGVPVAGSPRTLVGGTTTVSVGQPAQANVVFKLSGQSFQGDAQAYVSIDGQRLGGLKTIVASKALNQVQQMSFAVPLGAGPHTASVEFVNDLYGGSPTMDRNLFLEGISVDGVRLAVTKGLSVNGTATFDIPATVPTANGALTIESTVPHAVSLLPTY